MCVCVCVCRSSYGTIHTMLRSCEGIISRNKRDRKLFLTSFHPVPKTGMLVFIVAEHSDSSYLFFSLSSAASIFVLVLWLSIHLFGNPEKPR